MIYEMRTYDIKPRSLPEVEKRFGEAYEKRKKYSELAAFWHTEIGPLNQIIHVWGYKDLEERNKIREAAVKDKVWPPKIAEFIVSQVRRKSRSVKDCLIILALSSALAISVTAFVKYVASPMAGGPGCTPASAKSRAADGVK